MLRQSVFRHGQWRTATQGRPNAPLPRCRDAPLRVHASTIPASSRGRVLVLGGTGFVGEQVIKEFAVAGYDAVSISRREQRTQGPHFKQIRGDLIADPDLIRRVISAEGPFTAVVHAVGMLLPNEYNALASGSGSKPKPGTTFDQITRQTAQNAAQAAAEMLPGSTFCFVSAAEAGWSSDPPFLPTFMKHYLAAKRAVEARLADLMLEGSLRTIVLRPSLIWTPERPASILPVAAFYLGNAVGIPGIDRPVRVETLARAIVNGVLDKSVSGVLDYKGMEAVASGKRS